MIQTYNPYHYAITLAAKQDYEGFYRREMQERRLSKFPPYVYLSGLSFACKDEERCVEAAHQVKAMILDQRFPAVEAIGPMTPYFSLVGEYHQRIVLVKYRDPSSIKPFLASILRDLSGKGGVNLRLDVDALTY